MAQSLPNGESGRADDSDPGDAAAHLQPASAPMPLADRIHAELQAIAYWLADVLPEPLGRITATRALDILEDDERNYIRELCLLPDEQARSRFFLLGPVSDAVFEYWASQFADDPVAPTRVSQPRDTHTLVRLVEALDALTKAEQRVVVLCRVIGLTHHQAARLLSITRTSVQRRLAAADQRLRLLGIAPAPNPRLKRGQDVAPPGGARPPMNDQGGGT